MPSVIAPLLYFSGAFTLILGILHFFFPILFDFRGAIPDKGAPLKPFRLWFIRYATQRSDVYGIAWVMNHAASYTLVTVGLLDLFWTLWLHSSFGALVALWIAGWWFVRAASQLYVGRRWGDWLIVAMFAAFGVLHLMVI
jgi:hypothetical protein